MNRQLRRNEMKWLLNLSNKSSNLIRTQEMLIMVTKNVCIVKKDCARASLVAQWLGIRLPMQGTRVRALVREDPTCRRATKLVRHNY